MTEGTSTKPKMLPADLIVFFIEEAQHRVIDNECTKAAELALLALGKTTKKGSILKHKSKTKPDEHCENCKKGGHTKADCWAKGGGKEGQGPRAKAKEKKKTETGNSAALADSSDNSFSFFCTSTHMMSTNAVATPENKPEACIDSRASRPYCPDHEKFVNYRTITGRDIVTADGSALKVLGMGDVPVYLPNGDKMTRSLLKDVVHAPEMVFTLISVRRLDDANCTVLFKDGICMIKNPAGHIMAMIPHSNGLY